MRITGNQNLILLDVEEAWKADIITTLGEPGSTPQGRRGRHAESSYRPRAVHAGSHRQCPPFERVHPPFAALPETP